MASLVTLTGVCSKVFNPPQSPQAISHTLRQGAALGIPSLISAG
jgi:hypothetical protein